MQSMRSDAVDEMQSTRSDVPASCHTANKQGKCRQWKWGQGHENAHHSGGTQQGHQGQILASQVTSCPMKVNFLPPAPMTNLHTQHRSTATQKILTCLQERCIPLVIGDKMTSRWGTLQAGMRKKHCMFTAFQLSRKGMHAHQSTAPNQAAHRHRCSPC